MTLKLTYFCAVMILKHNVHYSISFGHYDWVMVYNREVSITVLEGVGRLCGYIMTILLDYHML